MRIKKNPIHGKFSRRFYEKKWIVEILASGPPALVAGIAASKAYETNSAGSTWRYLCAGLVWLVVAQAIKVAVAYKQDAKDDEQRSHDGLQAALKVLHAAVHDLLLQKSKDDPGLRATFHRVVPPLSDPAKLEQIVPYVGGSEDGEERTFPIHAGITGRAVRQKTIFLMARQSESDDQYRNELITDWNYTEADTRRMTMDRFSAMAIPVTDRTGQHVLGVIYLDAKRRNCFSSEDVQKLVVAAAGGITRYVGERYV